MKPRARSPAEEIVCTPSSQESSVRQELSCWVFFGSSGRTRTYNPSVNSCREAISAYYCGFIWLAQSQRSRGFRALCHCTTLLLIAAKGPRYFPRYVLANPSQDNSLDHALSLRRGVGVGRRRAHRSRQQKLHSKILNVGRFLKVQIFDLRMRELHTIRRNERQKTDRFPTELLPCYLQWTFRMSHR